jgi:hypothetical protein
VADCIADVVAIVMQMQMIGLGDGLTTDEFRCRYDDDDDDDKVVMMMTMMMMTIRW